MNGPIGELGSSSSEPLYYDPIDVPAPGSALLVVETDEEWSQGWRSDNLEFCLREYLHSRGDDGSDWIFRRVDETDWHTLKVWELPTTQKGDGRMLHPSTRLLACYRMQNSFTRTIQISPEIGDPLGIKEIYMHTDGAGENYSYLDRSGKVRPIHLIVDGDAVEIDCDEEYRREMVEYAILDCKRERLYPYNK
jgi:hypothetical protein